MNKIHSNIENNNIIYECNTISISDIFTTSVNNGKVVVTGIKDNLKHIENLNRIVIPETINQMIVAYIGEFAFSECRQLVDITLPSFIEKIGQHAFYNCRYLKRISLTDGVKDIYDGAFKNCHELSEINITKNNDKSKCLNGILSEINNEVVVSIKYQDGFAKLIFPYYILNYEENTPARIINQVTEGSGVLYRECIVGGDIDYQEYDKLFYSGRFIDINESAYLIAFYRIKYPYKLTEKYKQEYWNYIKENRFEFVMKFAKEENLDNLKGLLELNILDKEDVIKCCEQLRSEKYMESLGIVLDYQKEKYGTGKKKFEF